MGERKTNLERLEKKKLSTANKVRGIWRKLKCYKPILSGFVKIGMLEM
jgi:hypothetical protein